MPQQQEPDIYNNAIFWVEVDKIKPNPQQPRREFDQAKLHDLAESIRQYGVLQPLVVTRREVLREGEGLFTEYELIAGERRLRESRIAGLTRVPVIIRHSEDSEQMKLELAIIENLQREDLNAIDRARAFERLSKEFNFKHREIGERIGKSREYVANTIRLLMLPEDMQKALAEGAITEGHTRPLLMLIDRPEEQQVLFKDILYKKVNVREAEELARRIAKERARKRGRIFDPDIVELERLLCQMLGTRVYVEPREMGGKIHIDFNTNDDLRGILGTLYEQYQSVLSSMAPSGTPLPTDTISPPSVEQSVREEYTPLNETAPFGDTNYTPPPPKDTGEDEGLYSVKNFSI